MYVPPSHKANTGRVLLFNLLQTDSLKCPGFVWVSLFFLVVHQQQTNPDTQTYKNLSCICKFISKWNAKIYKCMEKFLQFSVSVVVAWDARSKIRWWIFYDFFQLWNAPEIIKLTRELNNEEQSVCYLLRQSCFLILTIFWFQDLVHHKLTLTPPYLKWVLNSQLMKRYRLSTKWCISNADFFCFTFYHALSYVN